MKEVNFSNYLVNIYHIMNIYKANFAIQRFVNHSIRFSLK